MTQESQVKVKVTTEDKTKPGTDSAIGNFQKFKGAIGDVAKSLTGLDLGTIGVVGAITMAAGEAKKAVSEYSNYVEQIDKMTMATGMSAEEMSRLAQVADDFRVDIGSLQTALGFALKNGFNPTTENLAKLADELEGISSPTERAEKLTKLFGRGWQAVIPLLDRGGQAIRDASGSITDGLVVTEDAIAANREYQTAVDNLQDAWTDAKNTFARDVIPVLTDVLNYLNANAEAARDAAKAMGEGYGKVEGLAGGYGTLADKMREATLEQIGMTEAEERARDAARRNADVIEEELTPAVVDSEDAYERYTRQAWLAAEGTAAVDEAARDSAAGIRELKGAQEEFNGTIEAFNNEQGGNVVSKLEAAGLKGEELQKALEGVDRVYGTNYASEKLMNEELDKIIANYEETGKVGDFTDALEVNRSKWAEVDDAILAAHTKFNNFIQSVAGADGLQIEIMVNAIKAWGGGGGGGGNTGLGNNELPDGYKDYLDDGGATGLHMTVPPGYDEINGRPFMIAAQSGETVDINPAGMGTKGNESGIYIAPGAIVINGAGQNADAIANAVLTKIGQRTRAGRLAGMGYAGG